MSKSIGKKSLYVDERSVAVANYIGELIMDRQIDQLRSDFNLLWGEENMRDGENQLFANVVREEIFLPSAHGAVPAISLKPYDSSPWEMRVASNATVTGIPLANPNEVKLGDLQTTTAIHIRCNFLDENKTFVKNWNNSMDRGTYSPAGAATYRQSFTYPKELLVQMSPNKEHNWGKEPSYIPEYLRWVHVVSPDSLPEETQRYAEKVGLSENWDKELDDIGDYQTFVDAVSDFFTDVTGERMENSPMIDPNTEYYDHTFVCDYMIADIENKFFYNGLAQGFEYELKSSYNFYYPRYETLTKDNQLEEIQLSDIYITLFDENASQPTKLGRKSEEGVNFNETNSDLALELLPHITNVPGLAQVTEDMRHMILSPRDIENMKALNKFHYKFPMHAQLRLNMGPIGPIAEILMESNLEETAIRRIVNSSRETIRPGANEAPSLNGFTKENFLITREDPAEIPTEFDEELYSENPIKLQPIVNGASVNTLNLDSFMASLQDLDTVSGQYGRYFVDERRRKELKELDGIYHAGTNPYVQNLAALIAKSRITTLAKQKMRTYAELLAGKAAYSETIMYRVAKHKILPDGQATSVAQKNYYFFNDPNTNIFELIDTQVKYAEAYRYYVYAYKVVIGSRYSYTDPVFEDTQWDIVANPDAPGALANGIYKFKTNVLMSPDIIICEVPIYGSRGLELIESVVGIHDEAPMYPNVDIVPYADLGSKVLINISENVGRYIAEPIEILDDDKNRHQEMIKFQNLRKGKKIIFESEDPPRAYEIFRIDPDPQTGITKKPSSYRDFGDNLKYFVERAANDSANASFVEELQLNRKYYYTFRTIDVHDNISNPSPVYEVELIGDENKSNVFPSIRVVDFDPKIGREINKPFKRYLHLAPTMDQFLVNSDDIDTAMGSRPDLGVKEKKLFEADNEDLKKRPSKFKIRLTSKKTGRKIDINVRFVHEHNPAVQVRKGHQ